MEQSEKLDKIISYLEGKFPEAKTPTSIGMDVFGYDYGSASSRMSSSLKKLVSEGKIVRVGGGAYKIRK